jgi:hypothetical protein
MLAAGTVAPAHWLMGKSANPEIAEPLDQFDYGQVSLQSELHEKQLEHTLAVLMNLNEDSLLKPSRQLSGQPAPGDDLGGWYTYNPDFDFRKGGDGFACSANFGQWVSALSRMYAIHRDNAIREKVLRLNRLYAKTISGDYYEKNRFPTYCFDKLVCGLIDSHRYVGDPMLSPFSIALPMLRCLISPHTRSNTTLRGVWIKTRVGLGTSRTRFRRISF